MNVLIWLISGLAAGSLVGRAMGGKEYGITGSLVIGTMGGLTGGWLFERVLNLQVPFSIPMHLFTSLIGGILFVAVVRILDRASRSRVVSRMTASSEGTDLDAVMQSLGKIERRVIANLVSKKPVATNPDEIFQAQSTFGERVADRVASFGGSWTFIGLFALVMALWIATNATQRAAFDPFPFILLNLVLSCLAAMQAPVIMMSQNRQASRDRIDAHNDYRVNLNAEMQIMRLHEKVDELLVERLRLLDARHEEQMALLRSLNAQLAARSGQGE
jgi:uncharacterized membrane protein/uncharacterized membrane protein YeaQ/YmgE (transglycosylase-associated protein family)